MVPDLKRIVVDGVAGPVRAVHNLSLLGHRCVVKIGKPIVVFVR